MIDILENKDIHNFTVHEMKDILQKTGGYYCLKNREEYVERIKNFKDVLNFSWRPDQKDIIDEFLKFKKKQYVIQGVFGSGKTTMLLGMLIQGILKRLFKPEEILFISFNVSIKNEIKRKLKSYGVSSKVSVRTFDSIIYEICKIAKYKYLDLPNFEGKRKFVYELCFNKEFKDVLYYNIFIQKLNLYLQEIYFKVFKKNQEKVFYGIL